MNNLTLTTLLFLSSVCAVSQGFYWANEAYGIHTVNTGAISHGAGVTFFDFNGDGLDDLTFCTASDSLIFYESTGDGFNRIEIIPNTLDMRMASWVDFDNDGDYDLLVTKARNVGNNTKIYRNDGWPVFTDVTSQLGMPNFGGVRSYGHSWGDYDRDGYIDLYICNYNYDPTGMGPTNWLFHNNGNGTFTEVSQQAGVANGHKLSFQSAWCDFNNDGWLDLYVITDNVVADVDQPCAMYYNNGDGTFTDVSEESGAGISIEAMCISVMDYQNDGDWDIYVSNVATGNYFLVNENGTFTNQAADAGLVVNRMTWGTTWIDFDNDNDQDIHMVTTHGMNNQNPFFINDGNDYFTEDNSVGFAGDLTNAYSNAKGDFNNDGFYDLIHSTIGSQNSYRLWENLGEGGNWVKVDLTGTYSNRDAVGSRVDYWVNGVSKRYFTMAGSGFLSQNAHTEIIGLGENIQIDSLIVQWPRGFTEKFYDLQAGQRYNFIEGQTLSASVSVVEETQLICDQLTLDAGEWAGFLWDDGSTGQLRMITEGGTYSVTVTHSSGIEKEASIDIIQGIFPQLDFTVAPVSCYGDDNGSIDVTEINGQEVSLEWSTESGELPETVPAGIYTVIATSADLCSVTESVEVTEPEELFTDVTTTDVSCNGGTDGTASVEITGGIPEYDVSWNEEIDPGQLPAGEYGISVTDMNGCTLQTTFTIEQPEVLQAEVLTTDALCFGEASGTAQVEVIGGTPEYTVQWNDQINTQELPEGNYSVVITDANQCELHIEFSIAEPEALTVESALITDAQNGNNGSIALNVAGGTEPYTFLWSNGDEDATAENIGQGAYSCIVTDAGNCVVLYEGNVIDLKVETQLTGDLSIFPNPATGQLNVRGSAVIQRVEIIDGTGRVVLAAGNRSNSQVLDIHTLSPGNYIVKLTSDSGVITRVLIIE